MTQLDDRTTVKVGLPLVWKLVLFMGTVACTSFVASGKVSEFVRATTRDEIQRHIAQYGKPLTREEFLEKQVETNASLRELKVLVRSVDERVKLLGR
jgi:hypothetical protein